MISVGIRINQAMITVDWFRFDKKAVVCGLDNKQMKQKIASNIFGPKTADNSLTKTNKWVS